MENSLQRITLLKTKIYLIWMLFGAVTWISIAFIYYVSGINWLTETDASGYWAVMKNPGAFAIAVQPLYPFIVRGAIGLFPYIDDAILGQLVSFTCYMLAIPFIYGIFEQINKSRAKEMTLLWALFPFTGVTMSVYPRANALFLVLTVLCYWGYIKNNRYVFLLSASLLPLVHKSSLFFLVFLLPSALLENKTKWWTIFLAGIPTFTYICLGSLLKYGSLYWYFQSYYKDIVPVTSLPFADGLVGTLILGLRGSVSNLMQGSIIVVYFLFNIYMLLQRLWRKNLIVLSTILPVILLGLVLPAREIMAMITYTPYAVISFSLLDFNDGRIGDGRLFRWLYVILIACSYISQIFFALYDLHFYGKI